MGVSKNSPQVAFGSVVGSRHWSCFKNNQDGYAVSWTANRRYLVGTVTDGISSCPHAEVGAKLVAHYLVQLLISHLNHVPPSAIHWGVVKDGLVSYLRNLTLLSLVPNDRPYIKSFARDHLSCVVAGFILGPRSLTFFRWGDPVFVVNGKVDSIDYPNNCPPAPCYEVWESTAVNPAEQKFVARTRSRKGIKHFMVASDGILELIGNDRRRGGDGRLVGGLSQFWNDDSLFCDSKALNLRLRQIGFHPVKTSRIGVQRMVSTGILSDDTTAIVVKM